MAYIKQFLTKTRPSDNTSIFRYSPTIDTESLEIYSLISIVNDVEAESSRFNKFVWDGLIDGFLQQEGDIITRLKNALIGAEFKLRELIRHDDLLEEKGVNLDLTMVVFKGSKAYIAVLGDDKVLVYKNEKVVDISKLLIENKSNVGTMLISPDDVLLVYHSKEKLDEKIFDSKELEEHLTKIFDNDEARGGAFLAGLREPRGVIKEPVVQEDVEETGRVEKSMDEEEVENQELDSVQEQEDIISDDTDILDEQPEPEAESETQSNKVSAVKEKLPFYRDKVRTFLVSIFSKSKEKVTSLKSKRGDISLKSLKVGGYKDKEVRTRRFVALAIFLVLILTLFFGIKSAFDARESQVIGAELQELIVDLEDRVDRAERAEVDAGLSMLNDVDEEFENYMQDLEETGRKARLFEEDVERVEEFRARLTQVYDEILQIIPVLEDENMEVFLDTRIRFGERSNPVAMTITKPGQIGGGENIYVVDRGERAVFEISLLTGEPRKVSDPEGLLSKPILIDLGNDPDNQGLYVYDSDVGVLVARKDEDGRFNDFKTVAGMSARALGGDKIDAFALFGTTDSLNFLVPSEGRIIRAQNFGRASYSLPTEFIAYPAFEDGFDLFGDQYIYVLTETPNGIHRFIPATSLSSPITITGLPYDLSISAGYTGNTMDRAFLVFDEGTDRFVYLQKPIDIGHDVRHPGELLVMGQFEYRGERDDIFTDVRGLVIEHTDTSMFVLDGTRIRKINIVLD